MKEKGKENEKDKKKEKESLHPKYFQCKVRCNCGNEFVTGSTKPEIRVEVCSKCHPFYTGSQKLLVEAGGRVEKFRKKYNLGNA
ncbi:MAG: 50S ribosomal protein L31 [Clostridiales bacterium]|nr:50S ribosomal protein L31 [Clostridiales bacterium]